MSAEERAADDKVQINEQQDGEILNCLIVAIGFGLCRAWIVFCLAAPFGQEALYLTNWVYLACGALAALLVYFVVQRQKHKIEQLHHALFKATGVLLVLSAILIPLAIAFGLGVLLFSGFVCGGAGAGLLQVLWGDRFAYYKTRFVTIVAPAAAIITALLVSSASLGSNIIGYVLFPLGSFGLLLLAAQRTGMSVASIYKRNTRQEDVQTTKETEEKKELEANKSTQEKKSLAKDKKASTKEESKRKPIGLNVLKLMFSIMVFSFLCRTFDAAPRNGEDPFAFFGGSALMSLVVVGSLFLIFVTLLKDRFNPTMTYRLSLPIMVAGFVALALLFETHTALSILLINIGYEFFDLLAWILFTDISRRDGEQPLRIFGLGVASMFIGMVLGIACGEVMRILILNGTVQITVIALMSILSLVIVAFLVIPEGTVQHLTKAISSDKDDEAEKGDKPKEKDDDSTTEKPAIEGRRECSCAVVAEEFRLTPREHEVLIMLSYGRTLTIISRDLQIAKGTARTHIENIYRKLDVHKQQELIDLVEDYEHE